MGAELQAGFISFMISAVFISLSGVMAPGPMTAAALQKGGRSPLSGVYIAFGHGVVEVPLIFLLYYGLGGLFSLDPVRITTGLLGGLYLLYLAKGMLKKPSKVEANKGGADKSSSFYSGAVLSAANPYFLLWWATVGLTLVHGSAQFGFGGVVAFSVVHWMCDLLWFAFLSIAAFKGALWTGEKFFRGVSLLCGVVLAVFGVKFIAESIGIITG